MQKKTRLWERSDAERRIVELLDAAKEGYVQIVSDPDGVFEIRFSTSAAGERTGEFLARGGPSDD